MRENIFQSVPHVIIGNKKPPQPQGPYPQQSYPYQPKRPDDLVDKLRKYALIVFVILILGTAAIFVLKEIIGRFL